MRKSFTLLFSTLMLLCAFGYSSFAAAPILASSGALTPTHNNSNVAPTTTTFVVKFDQNVLFTPTGGTFIILKDGTIVKTVALQTGNTAAVISGATLTVTHGLTLVQGSTYSVQITNNAIRNSANEIFAGIAAGAWQFTIGDYTRPVVGTLTPANNATNVDVSPAGGLKLKVLFTDVNNIEFVANKKVWLYKADGTIVDIITLGAGNTTVTGKEATISVSTNAYLAEYTKYYVHIEAGAFRDLSPNKNEFLGITNNTTWTFTSRDYSAPYAVSKSVDNITGTGGTLNVTLNEKGHVWYLVQAASVAEPTLPPAPATPAWTKVATNDAGVMTATLSGLNDGVEYTVYLVADNLATPPNQQTAADKVTFWTLDTTDPKVLVVGSELVKNVINEDNVTVGVSLVFDEEIEAGAGNLEIKRSSNHEVVASVAAADAIIEKIEAGQPNAGYWKMTARFAGLESEKDYYVIVPNGYVKDKAGNGYVSNFTSVTAWEFISADFIPPTVTVKILAGATPTANDNIEIKFSENVELIGSTAISAVSGGDQTAWFNYITLERNNVLVNFTANYTAGGTIIVDPASALLPNATYVVKIRANAFKDDAGNPFSSVHTSYNLVTGDFGAATIAIVPTNAAVNRPQGTNPTITFSKEARYTGGTTPAAITAANIKSSITFKADPDGTPTDVAFSVTWDATARRLTLVPTAPLASEGIYLVDFNHANVKDIYGGAFEDPTPSTFTMIDYIVPTITPSHTGTVTNKQASDNLTLTFSEDVTISQSPADIVIFKENGPDGNNLGFSATWNGTRVLTIDPSAPLENGKVYYYGIGANIATDGTNKNAAAFTTFTFAPAVPEMLEVAVGGYVPAIEATGIKANTSNNLVASLTFTEAVKANPVMPTNHSAYLYKEGNATAVDTVPILASYFVSNKLTITFTPASALDSEGKYYITLDPNVVVANANNSKTFAGIAANDWKFTAADVVKPVLSNGKPIDSGIKMDSVIVFNASEPVVAGTGNITIAAGTSDVKTVAVGSAVIVNTETSATITVPHANFTHYGTIYTVTVPVGAFKDMAGNANDVVLTWTFTTETTPALTFVLTPDDEEDKVALGTTQFKIEFSKEIVKGASGSSAFLFERAGATRAQLTGGGTVNLGTDILKGAILVDNPTAVVVAGKVATLDFGFALVAGKEYFILVENGMFKDKSLPTPALSAGLGVYGNWNFYTSDVNAPTWEVSYVERVEGMDITSNIVITFSKPIEKADGSAIVNADIFNFFNLEIGPAAVAFTGTINAEKTIVTLVNNSFNPALTVANSLHSVSVSPKFGIRGQVNHQPVVTTPVSQFWISDYAAPVITALAINENIEGIKFKFDITVGEDSKVYWIVQAGTGALTADVIKASGTALDVLAGFVNTVTVSTGIASQTQYTVHAVAVDATGNTSAISTLAVTTADITKPVVTAKTTTFTNAGVVTLTFSEDVLANGAVAVIRRADTHEIIQDNAPLSAGATTKQLNVTSSVAITYPDAQKFIIEISGGVVRDVSVNANKWDGQIGLGANAWVVGLNDRTPPTLVSISPALPEASPYAINIGRDAIFTLTFSEPIKLAANSQVIFYEVVSGGALVVFEAVEAAGKTVSGSVLTVNPVRTFLPSANYQLTITDGSILDLVNLPLAGSIVRQFSTVDNVAPTATYLPASNAIGVVQGTQPKITFSEPLVLTNGKIIDDFDLETLVYLRKGTVNIPHKATIDATKKVITITPSSPLDMATVYTYGFTAGFRDAAGNAAVAGQVSFTTVTPDAVQNYITFEPNNGIIDERTVVPVNQEFRITFAGQLYTYSTTASGNNIAVTPAYLQGATPGAGAITLKQGSANVAFTATIEEWTATKTVIVIKPNAALVSETPYDLTVLADKLQLGVGNAIVLQSRVNDYKTEDVSKPVVTAGGYVPVHNSDAGKSTVMSIAFNEDVKVGTGSIKIHHVHGEVVKTIDASAIVVNDNVVEITNLTSLTAGQKYYVMIPAGVITDLAGNEWVGITTAYQWQFTVTDEMLPVVINVAPVGDNTPVNTKLAITFDRAVNLNPSQIGFLALYDANGVAFQLIRINDGAANITFNADKTVATVTVNQLAQTTKYFVEVAQATFVSNADASLGNAHVVRSFWSFTTENNNPPMVVSLTPADNATNVSVLTQGKIVFDIDVKPGTGSIQLRKGSDASIVHSFNVNSSEVVFSGKTVTFNISQYLQGDLTAYYIIVPRGAITNISSEPEVFAGLEQITSWNFVTRQDGTAPELVTWTPNNVELANNKAVFVMTFNENVVLGNPGNLVVTKVGTTAPVLQIPLTAAMFSGNTVTVNYDEKVLGALEYQTEYFVTIAGGIIEDTSENPWAGVTDPTKWKFSTKDLRLPIADIQGTGSTSPMVNVLVKVTGTITAISAGEGFFMQDANAAWSGIWVEYDNVASLSIGGGAVVIGNVAEISEVTSIVATQVQTIAAPIAIVPVVINNPADVKAEMYESVLVKVVRATATEPNTSNIWNIYHTTAGNSVAINRWFFTYTPVAGHLYDVTGIVNGRLSNYRMEPRMVTDIVHYLPIANIQGTGSASPMVNDVVNVIGTITGISAGEGFFMQDANAAWSGIWVEHNNVSSLSIGDGIVVRGRVAEISEVTSIVSTEATKIDAPLTVVAVVVESPGDAKAEKYESVLVQVLGARANAANTAGVWTVYYQPINNIAVNRWMYRYTPVADHFYNVTGILNGRLGDYKLEPRMESDIYDVTLGTDVPVVRAADFKIYPNPFNDRISIDNHDKLTRVIITNIAGQRVIDVQYPEREIRTANLNSGVYVISLYTVDGMVKSDRIVKR